MSKFSINFAYKFETGEISLDPDSKFNGIGFLPQITYEENPKEHIPTETELSELVGLIQDWLKSVGLSAPECLTIGSDVVRSNFIGVGFPTLAKLSHEANILYYQFLLVFFILDDVFDVQSFQKGESSSFNITENLFLTKLFATFKSIWLNPRTIASTNQPHIVNSPHVIKCLVAGWKSVVENLEEINPDYADDGRFIVELEKHFLSNAERAKTLNKVHHHSEYVYRNSRKHLAFFGGVLEFAALLCEISISKTLREHPFFLPMWNAAGDAISFENDIMSIHKEIKDGEKANLIFIKIEQGAPVRQAFEETGRCIWDSTYGFIHYASMLLKEFPHDAQLSGYLNLMVELINGSPKIYNNMARYTKLTGKVIPVKHFSSIDEQFAYVYKNLLPLEPHKQTSIIM